MSENIKPCPFCGSLNVDVFYAFGEPSTDKNFMDVECINCGAQGGLGEGEEKAIAAWNRRAGNEAVYSEIFTLVKGLAESDNYPRDKEIKLAARRLIQRIKSKS